MLSRRVEHMLVLELARIYAPLLCSPLTRGVQLPSPIPVMTAAHSPFRADGELIGHRLRVVFVLPCRCVSGDMSSLPATCLSGGCCQANVLTAEARRAIEPMLA